MSRRRQVQGQGQMSSLAWSAGMSEAQFQALVISTAKTYGWLVMHVRRSMVGQGQSRRWVTATSLDGWPDLTLIHPRGYLLFLELKAQKGYPSDEQIVVMRALQSVASRLGSDDYTVRAYIVRPSDWPAVERMLCRPSTTLAKGASVPTAIATDPTDSGATP